jgi:hypothetical protein
VRRVTWATEEHHPWYRSGYCDVALVFGSDQSPRAFGAAGMTEAFDATPKSCPKKEYFYRYIFLSQNLKKNKMCTVKLPHFNSYCLTHTNVGLKATFEFAIGLK